MRGCGDLCRPDEVTFRAGNARKTFDYVFGGGRMAHVLRPCRVCADIPLSPYSVVQMGFIDDVGSKLVEVRERLPALPVVPPFGPRPKAEDWTEASRAADRLLADCRAGEASGRPEAVARLDEQYRVVKPAGPHRAAGHMWPRSRVALGRRG